MPAEPIPPEQQAEVDGVLLIASAVRARGTYSEAFAEALRALNALCAKIFHAPDPDADEEPKAGWA